LPQRRRASRSTRPSRRPSSPPSIRRSSPPLSPPAERLEADRETSLRQWRLGVERASYEASRAERRYRAVDPNNRLMARGLEREREERLTKTTAAEFLGESRDPKASSHDDHQFESPPLHQVVRTSGGGFPGCKILRDCRALEWPITVFGSNIAGLSASCGRMRPKVSGRKIPFPKMVFALSSSRPTALRCLRHGPQTNRLDPITARIFEAEGRPLVPIERARAPPLPENSVLPVLVALLTSLHVLLVRAAAALLARIHVLLMRPTTRAFLLAAGLGLAAGILVALFASFHMLLVASALRTRHGYLLFNRSRGFSAV
jgi:hypothetical protein